MLSNKNFGSGPVIGSDNLKRYMTSVYNKMLQALCLTGVVAYICATNESILTFMAGGFWIFLMLATFGIVFYLSAKIYKINSEKANILLWAFSAILGASLAPMLVMYTGENIANAFFGAATFFGGMSLYGYITKKDLTGMGSFMIVGLFAVVITSLINLFLGSTALQTGLSVLTLFIFCGLTAYDIQKIKNIYTMKLDEETAQRLAVLGALQLYLDFINIFIALLRLLGNRK
jgi:FtsH-binding integral membrane protein